VIGQALNVTRDDLKKDIGSEADVKDLFDNIEADYADFRQTWELGPYGDLSRKQSTGIIEAAKDVALLIYRKTGDADEARHFAFSLFDANFEVVTSTNVQAIVPRDLRIDASDVEDATELMQTRERIEAFAPLTFKSGNGGSWLRGGEAARAGVLTAADLERDRQLWHLGYQRHRGRSRAPGAFW
jgi:hypothetical protein